MSQSGDAQQRAEMSNTLALEQDVSNLEVELHRRKATLSLLQVESDVLRALGSRLDASRHSTMDRVTQFEGQLRRLRAGKTAKAAVRKARIDDLQQGEADESCCEMGRSQQLADLARQAQSAEQRLERTQLWAREQLRLMAAAHAQSLDAFSQRCRESYEHAERTLATMRTSLDDARRRLAQSRMALVEWQSRSG